MSLTHFSDIQTTDSTISSQAVHGHPQPYSRQRLARRAVLGNGGSLLSVPGNTFGYPKRSSAIDITGYSSNLEPIGELGGFDNYLSDASEENSNIIPTEQTSAAPRGYQGSRRYLNRCINDTAEWAVDERTLATGSQAFRKTQTRGNSSVSSENESSVESNKSSGRQSWATLGRRLSLRNTAVGNAFSAFSSSQQRSPDAALASRDDTFSHSLHRADGLQPIGARRRTSWLGSIKKRIKGKDRKNRGGGVETMPITSTFFEENEDRGADDIVDSSYAKPDTRATDTLFEAYDSAGSGNPVQSVYPRLRSQPSLSSSSARNTDDESSIYNANEVGFVPDTDNLMGNNP
ncbi:hypothetical protein GGI11_004458, partial [Coemansia sp. RSA 2049]